MNSNQQQPSVSVIVTAFNQASFIGDTLISVFAQTRQPSEVIVVNDGSTDDTEAKIAPFKHRIRYISQENHGVAAARNTGIQQARSEWLAFLDGDDLWEPQKLAVQLEAAQNYPEAGLVVVDGVQFSGDSIVDDSLLGVAVQERMRESSPDMLIIECYKELLNANLIATTSQVMIPRVVFQKVGLSDSRFRICSDYDLYLRISKIYPAVFINQQLVRWRYLASSASGPARLRSLRWIGDMIAVRKKHLNTIPLDYRDDVKRWIRRDLRDAILEAYYYGHNVDRRWATWYLMTLFAQNPARISIAAYLAGLWLPSRVHNFLRTISLRSMTKNGAAD